MLFSFSDYKNLHLFVFRISGCFVPPLLGELRLLELVEASLNLFFFLCWRVPAESWDVTQGGSSFSWHPALKCGTWKVHPCQILPSSKWETQPGCPSPFHSRRVNRPSLLAGSCMGMGTHAVFRFITPSFLFPLFPCQCFVAMATVITPGGF